MQKPAKAKSNAYENLFQVTIKSALKFGSLKQMSETHWNIRLLSKDKREFSDILDMIIIARINPYLIFLVLR